MMQSNPEQSLIQLPSCTDANPIFETNGYRVFRAKREANGEPVLAKWLKSRKRYPWLEILLRNEYRLGMELNFPSMVQVIELIEKSDSLLLIMEDVTGDFLQTLLAKQTLDFKVSLNLVGQVAEILSELHRNQIIHKDIRPANMLVNPANWCLKLTGFGMATTGLQDTPAFSSSLSYLNHLAYISPEQTGRMNRDLDYRSDFYSLGITLYQLLTGKLPFDRSERMALIHDHLAVRPNSVGELCPDIPDSVSAIVDKLLQKNPEDRYQTAAALIKDIQTCIKQWKESGTVIDFKLAEDDTPRHFLIPSKLYGRHQELQSLQQSFARIAAGGVELVILSGPAGIGKSTLVQAVFGSITAQSGLFIGSYFTETQYKAPYSAWIRAFRSHLRNLLSQNSTEIEYWRTIIADELGCHAPLMVNLVPELHQVLSLTGHSNKDESSEPDIQISILFVNFIRAFCRSKHPLTIFLDNMQWADTASLELLSVLASSTYCCPGCQHLMIVCSYQEGEIEDSHPLKSILDNLESTGTAIVYRPIGALPIDPLVDWLQDIFHGPRDSFIKLAELLYSKAGGNPLRIKDIVNSLYHRNAFFLDTDSNTWHWKMDDFERACDRSNTKELLLENYQVLKQPAKSILQSAAAIGNYFTLQTLKEISGYSVDEILRSLDEAIENGLIIRLDLVHRAWDSMTESSNVIYQGYRFIHRDTHKTIYITLSPKQRSSTHTRIGMNRLEAATEYNKTQQVYDIANHLNLGLQALNTQQERTRLAQLNLDAGILAESVAAYSTASIFCDKGLDILNNDGWHIDYVLTLKLSTLSAKASLHENNYSVLETRYRQINNHAYSALDKSAVRRIKIKALIAQRMFQPAIDLSLHSVRELGLGIPTQPTKIDFFLTQRKVSSLFKRLNIEKYSRRQTRQESIELATMEILCSSLMASYAIAPEFYSYTLLKLTNLALEFGNNPVSPAVIIGYGGMLCEHKGDIAVGWDIASAGNNLNNHVPNREFTHLGQLLFFCFVAPWKQALSDIVPELESVVESSHTSGQLDCAERCVLVCENYHYLSGRELTCVKANMAEHDQLMLSLKQKQEYVRNLALRRVISVLSNRSRHANQRATIHTILFGNISPNQQKFEGSYYFFLHFHKSIIDYLFSRFEDARQSIEIALRHRSTLMIGGHAIFLNFYDSLTRLALVANESKRARERSLRQVSANQKMMKNWAQFVPQTCQNKYLLVEAELARVLGKPQDAEKYFDAAIQASQTTGGLHETGLAWELSARFYKDIGRSSTVQYFLEQAFNCYHQWGAWAKIRDLSQGHPDLSFARIQDGNDLHDRSENDLSSTYTDLTNNTIQAAATFSTAQDNETLFLDLMKLTTEVAVAQKAVLILKQESPFNVVAEAVDDGLIRHRMAEPVENYPVPASMVNQVIQSGIPVLLQQSPTTSAFSRDPHFSRFDVDSVICLPIKKTQKILGVLYLENLVTKNIFTPQTIELLNIYLSLGIYALDNMNLASQLRRELGEVRSDQSQLKATEARLRESENHTRAILDTSLDAVVSIDQEGLVIDWSAKAQEIFGWKSQDAMGKLLSDLIIPAESQKAHKIGLKRFVQTGQGSVVNRRIEITAIRLDGTKIPVELAIAPIFSGGKYTFSAFIRDLTEQRKIQAELNQQREALHQSEKLNALGSLLAGVSHELNNPLSVVVGRSMMLQDEIKDPETAATVVKIRNAAERCAKIVRSFLAIARQQEPNREPLQINQLLHSAIELVGYGLKADGITIHLDLKEHLPLLLGDAEQLRQVFTNIIVNARQALQPIEGHRQITVTTYLNESTELVIEIADNGPGVPEEIRNRIFEPFYTNKPVGEGTGFGLSYSKGVVESHAGSLYLEIPPEGGAKFVTHLPADLDLSNPDSQTETSVDLEVHPFSILIVDDEVDVSDMLADILKKEGHVTQVAENGKKALEVCQNSHFDLIVCDLHMPILDGFQFFQQLSKRKPEMKKRVVFITGDSLGMGDMDSLKIEHKIVIEKPVIPLEFVKTVNKVLLDLEE